MAALAVPIAMKAFAGKSVYDTVQSRKEAKKQTAALQAAATPKPPAPMPDDEELRRTSRRNAAIRFGALGSGRASTVLSSDKLGA